MLSAAAPIDPGTGGVVGGVLLIAGYGVWRLLKLVLDSNERVSKENAEAQRTLTVDNRVALEALEARHEKFLSNHMHETTDAMKDMATQLRIVTEKMSEEHERSRAARAADIDKLVKGYALMRKPDDGT